MGFWDPRLALGLGFAVRGFEYLGGLGLLVGLSERLWGVWNARLPLPSSRIFSLQSYQQLSHHHDSAQSTEHRQVTQSAS